MLLSIRHAASPPFVGLSTISLPALVYHLTNKVYYKVQVKVVRTSTLCSSLINIAALQ